MAEEEGTAASSATPRGRADAAAPTAAAPPAEAEGKSAPPKAAPPVEEWETRFKYLFADFENFRKRVDREREALRDRARADVLRALLPVYEAALRAREAVGRLGSKDPVRRGIELLAEEWQAFLDAARVTPVAKTGAAFESDLHEAVAEAPVSPNHPEGTVVEIVQQGYRMGPVLLRPAKVVVARSAAAASEAASAASPEERSPG